MCALAWQGYGSTITVLLHFQLLDFFTMKHRLCCTVHSRVLQRSRQSEKIHVCVLDLHFWILILKKNKSSWWNLKIWPVHKIFFIFSNRYLVVNQSSIKEIFSHLRKCNGSFHEKIIIDFICNNFEMLWKWFNHSDSQIEPKPLGA